MCGCARIQNSLGLTETWVDGIGAPQIDGKIVRLPCYVRRGKNLHLVACLAMTIDAFLQAVQESAGKKINYTSAEPVCRKASDIAH